MILSKRKRVLLASILILMGIILCIGKEYFVGSIAIIGSVFISLNIGTTKNDKLAWFVLGLYLLIGVMISFFYPKLIVGPSAYKMHALNVFNIIFERVVFTIVGIYMILHGISVK